MTLSGHGDDSLSDKIYNGTVKAVKEGIYKKLLKNYLRII